MASRVRVKDKVLRAMIKAAAGQQSSRYTIADGVEYGMFQEFGSSKTAAQPFLTPAFERVTKQLPQAIGAAVEAGVPVDDVVKKAAFDILALAQSRAPVDTGALRNSLHVESE